MHVGSSGNPALRWRLTDIYWGAVLASVYGKRKKKAGISRGRSHSGMQGGVSKKFLRERLLERFLKHKQAAFVCQSFESWHFGVAETVLASATG